MIAIDVNDNGLQVRMKALAGQLKNPRSLVMVVGREATNQLKAHFRNKERTEPNKLGGRRTHFWRDVAAAVQMPIPTTDGQSVTVSINHPAIAQKVFGGRITAKRAGALTIPRVPEAYGRSAATYEAETGNRLFLFKTLKGAYLAAALNDTVKIIYSLKKSVDQKPDPTALPDEQKLKAALEARAVKHVARITQKPNVT